MEPAKAFQGPVREMAGGGIRDLDLGLPGLSKLLEALNGGLFDVGR